MSNLQAARAAKNDEFYTRLSDIAEEVQHYSKHLAGKIVYCPCDDPTWSKFYEYFKTKYSELQLAKLVTTHYVAGSTSYMREFDGSQEVDTQLTGDGDFRSDECKAILNQVDIVITNPPFSLFREFVALLQQKQKQFLIIGNMNAITYKECFKLIKDNKMWLGLNSVKVFIKPDGTEQAFGNIIWFTNLIHSKRNQPIDLYKNYSPAEYPNYDNYHAIEVSKVKDIPQDYTGVMGVPITFLDKYCPDQFEILDINPHFFSIVERGFLKPAQLKIANQKDPYARILIKHKNPVTTQGTI